MAFRDPHNPVDTRSPAEILGSEAFLPTSEPSAHLVVHADRCGNWCCPKCGAARGARLAARLGKRLRGESVVMLTLTFDRARFASPTDAYERCKAGRWVSRAIGDYAASLAWIGAPEWFCKMELQSGGWPHFHVLLVVPAGCEVPRAKSFDDFWDHGFSNVMTRCVRVSYVCKYVAKVGSELEERIALSGLPGAGVRWTSCSRGFWGIGRRALNVCDGDGLPVDAADLACEGASLDGDASFAFGALDDGTAVGRLDDSLLLRVRECGSGAAELRVIECSLQAGAAPVRVRLPVDAGRLRDLIEPRSVLDVAQDSGGCSYWLRAPELLALIQDLEDMLGVQNGHGWLQVLRDWSCWAQAAESGRLLGLP